MTSQILTQRLRGTPVFEWNYYDPTRIKINQGGTSSGKTYSILQVISLRLIDRKQIATVVGQDIPNLKKGALRDYTDRILVDCPWLYEFIEGYNKTERTFRFKNGSILEFTSFKDAQDAKNGKRDILFLNEANGISWPVYEQLEMRTSSEIFIDYNPTSEFWAHERLMRRENSITFYSNFTHNPFVDPNVREYIIGLKDEDLESWKVYGLGKTGAIAEICIENMTIVDRMPKHLKRRGHGCDWGYRADPTTLIDCGWANERDIYFDELFYVHRMKTNEMALTMSALGISKKKKTFADPADSRALEDMQDRGWNFIAATKGADSVKYGLSLLNQYNIHVTARSVNMINERKRYRYKVDKDGKVLNEPIKAFDHTWDAARYWAMMNLKPIRTIQWQYKGAVA